jgi:hypothetical protein
MHACRAEASTKECILQLSGFKMLMDVSVKGCIVSQATLQTLHQKAAHLCVHNGTQVGNCS